MQKVEFFHHKFLIVQKRDACYKFNRKLNNEFAFGREVNFKGILNSTLSLIVYINLPAQSNELIK
jgi:hypothetical protein